MKRGLGRRADERRRSGPEDEARWWDPDDQRLAERAALSHRDFPKKWRIRPLMNNAEALDPLAEVPEGAPVVEAAGARTRTALDDGMAVAGPDLQLAVLRVEVFAAADDGAHRQAWQADGPAATVALYRHRWRERDQRPGFIEAGWPDFDWDMHPDVDWLRLEDHTDRRHEAGVFYYEHLWLWVGRSLGQLTFRYAPGFPAESLVADLADAAMARLAPFAAP